ncbi:hypothetical protein [Haloglomus litoreum]|uniref:hypothetical protein n=1 Tax=Haloglomus litoreum TaxID=3034026 RepID=UPI0023E80841|nr:hypothetical protein [Haloglomus sp. DT116]
MDLDRRSLLRRAGAGGLAVLAGCSGSDGGDGGGGDGASGGATPTGTPGAASPSPTPACGDSNYIDEGEFSFEYGVVTHNDPDNYDGTLRIYHIRTPVCNFPGANPTPAFPGAGTPTPTVSSANCEGSTETLLKEQTYRVTSDLTYDIVDAPVTPDVDTYRLEWEAAGGMDVKKGVEEGARAFVDTQLEYEFFVCNPGARRFGFAVADGKPRIVRSPTAD